MLDILVYFLGNRDRSLGVLVALIIGVVLFQPQVLSLRHPTVFMFLSPILMLTLAVLLLGMAIQLICFLDTRK
jgi:hypothetical protein